MSTRSHGVAWAARARHVHTRSDSATFGSLGNSLGNTGNNIGMPMTNNAGGGTGIGGSVGNSYDDDGTGHSQSMEVGESGSGGAQLYQPGIPQSPIMPGSPLGFPQQGSGVFPTASDESDHNQGGLATNGGPTTTNVIGNSYNRRSGPHAGLLRTPTTRNGPGSFRRTNSSAVLGLSARVESTAAGRSGASPVNTSDAPVVAAAPKAPVWKRALYEKQPFEDNYVDDSMFLVDMRKNANFREYNYKSIVKDMFALVQQASITVIFVVMFVAVHGKTVSKLQMIGLNAVLLVSSLVIYIALKSNEAAKRKSDSESAGGDAASQTGDVASPSSSSSARTTERRRSGANNTARKKMSVVASAVEHSSVDEQSSTQQTIGGSGNKPSTSRNRSGELAAAGKKQRPTTTAETIAAKESAPLVELPDTFKLVAKSESDESATFFGCLRQGVIFTLVLLLLAPIFRTMTASYAADTIQALCLFLFFIHNLFTDYNYINGYHSTFEQSTAGNAALFASVLLASRIESPAYASTLIGFGVQCFTLSPLLRHNLKRAAEEGHIAVTFTLCGIAIGCLMTYSPLLAFLFIIAVISIVFVIPWAFVSMQARYKFQINGPWDEAKPKNSPAAAEWATAGLLQ